MKFPDFGLLEEYMVGYMSKPAHEQTEAERRAEKAIEAALMGDSDFYLVASDACYEAGWNNCGQYFRELAEMHK